MWKKVKLSSQSEWNFLDEYLMNNIKVMNQSFFEASQLRFRSGMMHSIKHEMIHSISSYSLSDSREVFIHGEDIKTMPSFPYTAESK